MFNLFDWLSRYWILLALTLICGAYFAFYVMLARERRDEYRNDPGAPRRRHEKDC